MHMQMAERVVRRSDVIEFGPAPFTVLPLSRFGEPMEASVCSTTYHLFEEFS